MAHHGLGLTVLIAILSLTTLTSAQIFMVQPNNLQFLDQSTQNSVYASDDASNENFSIVVLPDIQGYSRFYPWIADNQTQWIVDNIEALNIMFVSQLSDIVDQPDNLTQWENANSSLSKLDGNVPWAVLPGNHDLYDNCLPTYNEFFGQDRFNGYGWYGGSYLEDDNSNSFQLFSGGGADYLILHLGYNPNDDVLFWASNVIDAYHEMKVIVSTHDYLAGFQRIGQRSDIGERIWHSLVKPHANQVFLVLCGHAGIEDLITDNINGHIVYQVLADFQNVTNIESGWLRILQFCPSQDKIYVKTYSPLLNMYKTGSQSEFTIDYKTGNASPAKPDGTTNENNTIYIRQDGTVDPSTAPIQRNGDVYTFKGDISGSIIVERNNVVIDGAGFTLRGTGAEDYRPSEEPLDQSRFSDFEYMLAWFNQRPDPYIIPDSNNTGIYSTAQGLTIQNLEITDFWCAVELEYSSDNVLAQNQIKGNTQGIWIHISSNNTISSNNIDNNKQGITLTTSHDNINGNKITNNSDYGIKLQWSFNSITRNNIASNGYGVCSSESPNNFFTTNNFINNTNQVQIEKSFNDENIDVNAAIFTNSWSNGNKGNYWSDYESRYPNASKLDSGTWNIPYVIGELNQDNNPLTQPIKMQEEDGIPLSVSLLIVSIAIALTIICVTGFAYIKKKQKRNFRLSI